MYYVYEHYKKTDDEIFYVGIGRSINGQYTRASSNIKRNPHWHSVVNKHEFYHRIVFESADREEVCQKEIELILKYGRRDLGSGTLVNMTTGGEKTFEMSKESVKNSVSKRIENGTYDKCAEIARHRMLTNNPWKGKTHDGFNKRKIYQYDSLTGNFIGEWKSIRSAVRHLGCDPKTISWALSGKKKNRSGLGFIWSYDYLGEKIDPSEYKKWSRGGSKIIQEIDDSGNIIGEWGSISKLGKELGIEPHKIKYDITRNRKILQRIFKIP